MEDLKPLKIMSIVKVISLLETFCKQSFLQLSKTWADIGLVYIILLVIVQVCMAVVWLCKSAYRINRNCYGIRIEWYHSSGSEPRTNIFWCSSLQPSLRKELGEVELGYDLARR